MLSLRTWGYLSALGICLLAETAISLGPSKFKQDNPEYLLFQYLFTNYSNSVRPIRNASDVVPVSFDIGFSQIVNLHEKKQILISNLWVRLEWYDPWITWNESTFGGINLLNVEPGMVWKPDIVLYNNVHSDSSGEMYMFSTKVLLYSTGKVRWLSPIQVQSECKIDITNFPLDDQKCKLEFGSWAYDGLQLNLTNARETADLSMYTTNGEWEMLSGNVFRKLSYFSCCKAPYITLIYTFHLRRRALFYLMNLILPCVLLTFLSALTFRFPPESGERVSLTITILLGMTVFMLIFIDNIPPTSEVVPLIGRYFSCSVVIMGSSLVATCISLSFYYNKPSTQIPFWLRILTFRCLGPALGIRPPKHTITTDAKPTRERANSNRGMLLNDSNDKRRRQNQHPCGAMRKLENTSMLSQSTSFPNNLDRSQTPVIRVFLESEAARYPPDQLAKNQSCCCCCRSSQSSEDAELEEKREEWHYVAAVVDRAFFYLFIVIICLCALIVFLLSPAVGMMF